MKRNQRHPIAGHGSVINIASSGIRVNCVCPAWWTSDGTCIRRGTPNALAIDEIRDDCCGLPVDAGSTAAPVGGIMGRCSSSEYYWPATKERGELNKIRVIVIFDAHEETKDLKKIIIIRYIFIAFGIYLKDRPWLRYCVAYRHPSKQFK